VDFQYPIAGEPFQMLVGGNLECCGPFGKQEFGPTDDIITLFSDA
jgi:hypothetical protein